MPYIANPLEGLPIRNSFIVDQASLGAAAALDDTLLIYDISATALKQLTVSNLQAGILASPTFTGVPAAPTAGAGTNTTQLATTAFVTTATTALNTITEMTDVTISSIGSGEILKWNGSAWINNDLSEAGILPVAGPTFTGVLTVGSAVISEADLEQIDDLTAGTAVASKALVVNSNKDIGTLRNLTIDGVFTDGNYTFDTSGNVSGLGTIGSGNITSTGTVQGTTITATTAFVPDASDGAALGTASLEFSDLFLADAAVISLGDDDDVTLTHVVDTGILLSSTDRFQFGDAGTFIHQSADGVLTIESDTTVDINGAVVFDGALSGITTLTASGVVTATGFTIGSAAITEAELEILDGASVTTAELNLLDALDRGSILYGNASGVTTVLGQGTTDQVLTSNGTDISWEDAGGTTINQNSNNRIITGSGTANTLNAESALIFNNTSSPQSLELSGNMIIYGSISLSSPGNVTVDGLLEADAYTVDGVALSTYIRDTVGTNMLSGNTETGIAVTYDTSSDTIDFALDAAQTVFTTIYNTILQVGRNQFNMIDFSDDDKIKFWVNGIREVELSGNVLYPAVSNGVALGTGTQMWKDLFLASGGVVNFNNGDMTLTHGSNILTVAGGTLATAALTTSTIVASGEVTGTTIEATAATSAGDNAAMGYTSAEGLILTGQGSSYDVSIKNDTGVAVMVIPTGTTTATFKGILHTDVTTNATNTLNGSIQTSGGLSVVKDAVIGDDLMLLSDGAVLGFGVNQEVTITHIHNVGLSVVGDILPGANNTHDLGSSSYQWQNIYTQDFHLNNTLRDEGNSIDGTKGNWTIQEGDENLFIVNNETGKKYKFHLTEVA